jgi:4-amino-4-deoxy-L-arabinose transferase-like glycosyltransferase
MRSQPSFILSGERNQFRRHCRNILIAIVIVGGVCRTAQYLSRRSFWHDEAFVVLDIRDHSPDQLMGRLDYHQAAPPLFLLGELGVTRLLGNGEYPFRLLPLLAGLAGLCLFAVLAWKTLPPRAAPWAVALLALSDQLILQATEVKQYSGDLLVAILLLYLLLGVVHDAAPSLKRFAVVALVAALAIWCSYTTFFLFGGISLALLPRFLRRGRRHALVYVLCNALVVASFLLLFLTVLHAQRDAFLQRSWAGDFIDLSHPLTAVFQIGSGIYTLFDYPFYNLGLFMLIPAAAGAAALVKSRRYELLGMLLLPVLLNLIAGILHKYPFGGSRTTIYLLPGLLLLIGYGIDDLADHLPLPWRRWYWAIPLPMIVAGIAFGSYHLIFPRTRSDIRPIAQYVHRHRQPGQAIYALGEGPAGRSVEFFCYWPHPAPPVYTVMNLTQDPPTHRFWIIWSFLPHHGLSHAQGVLHEAQSVGNEIDHFVVPGGAAFLFQRRP